MFDIDFEKIKALKDKHWDWFWYRAGEKIIEIKTKAGGKISLSCKNFWDTFFAWDEDTIRNIVLASFQEMKVMIDENKPFIRTYQKNLKWLKDNFTTSRESMENLIWDSFGYTSFKNGGFQNPQKPKEKWSAYIFIKTLGINVCPYCGRNYIFTIGDDDDKNGRPEIDHFIPEQEFPFLSCSLYNFVPSCHQCNHQKHDDYNKKKDDIIKWVPYPYVDYSKGEKTPLKFRAFYKIQDNELTYGIRIRKKGTILSDEFINANNAFHLEELYKCHEIEIEDLFLRYRNYRNHKIKEIISLFSQTSSIDANNLFLIIKIKKMILGLPIYKGNKEYPLKKFKEDIIEQLDCMKRT